MNQVGIVIDNRQIYSVIKNMTEGIRYNMSIIGSIVYKHSQYNIYLVYNNIHTSHSYATLR